VGLLEKPRNKFNPNRKQEILMINMLKSLHKEESGQDLIEYALLAALIAVALIASMSAVASGISSEFSKVIAQL